jgi:hypothetical protein
VVNGAAGLLSTEQIYVLEARSAMLPPPATDIPTAPAPDAAAQKAILDKATDYAAKVYGQLPHLTATKTTLRFQEVGAPMASASGLGSAASDVSTGTAMAAASPFIRYYNSIETKVESENGAEKPSTTKDTTRWGSNGQIALKGQGPVLSTVMSEAQGAGNISFLRWETVLGKQVAVFAFEVDKKKSHYAVNYCCFPEVDQTGTARFTSASGFGAGSPGGSAGSAGGASGNMQTNARYDKVFKATVPYRGQIFVDPDTGTVLRLLVLGEFKSSDIVHQEDQRIDYGPVTVDGKVMILPLKSVVDTEVVPNGDSGAAGKYSTRHTLFTSEYKGYQK